MESEVTKPEKEEAIEENKSTETEIITETTSGQSSEEIESTDKELGFKKPLLIIGPRKGGFKKTLENDNPPPPPPPQVKKSTIPALQVYSDPHKSLEQKQIPPLPYSEPEWGTTIPIDENYSLEILKNGVIIETIPLNTKSFYTFGRLSNCDVQMNHPSSSRYHAILQYRSESTDNNTKGFYIYDLGSTHGTFLNKNRLKVKVYAPIKVGQFFKIGGSARMIFLQGPAEDAEPESDLSVTELRKQRIEKEKEAELERLRLEKEAEIAEQKRKEEIDNAGIDWGMGEDADEETDLTENPFAATTNEELYVADPKKSLRGWFEREGEELNYDLSEKTSGQFLCRVVLPVDGPNGRSLVAEALVRGKKKEAVVQCAMEACRILDRQGLLRQSTHESKQRKKRDWADDDFYDSDEDTFLDRTGSVETKRERRMAAAGKLEARPQTYESLLQQLEEKDKEIQAADAEYEALNSETSGTSAGSSQSNSDAQDALDEFMSSLGNQSTEDKLKRRQAKAKSAKLRSERQRLCFLIEKARPASLPKLELNEPPPPPTQPQAPKLFGKLNKGPIKFKLSSKESSTVVSEQHKKQEEPKPTENSDYEEEDEDEPPAKIPHKSEPKPGPSKSLETSGPSKSPETSKPSNVEESSKIKERKLGPSIPEEFLRQLRGETGEEEGGLKQPRKRNRVRPQSKQGAKFGNLDEERADYSTWVPPADQSGDGKTKLNDKYGY